MMRSTHFADGVRVLYTRAPAIHYLRNLPWSVEPLELTVLDLPIVQTHNLEWLID